MKAIELFSGAGGLSLGAEAAGIICHAAIEKDVTAAKTYSNNFEHTIVINKDINDVTAEEIEGIVCPDIIMAGPPCQAFSTSNQKTRTDQNPQTALLMAPMRFVKYFRPRLVLVENVHGLAIGTRKLHLKALISHLEELSYHVQVLTIVGTEIGLPQRRTRLFIVASIDELKEVLLPTGQSKHLTVRDAIEDLPLLDNGDQPDIAPYRSPPPSRYAMQLRGDVAQCDGHLITNNQPEILDRYKHIPPGGNWKSIPRDLLQNYSNVERCHTGIYHRLDWDLPSKVLGNFRKNMLVHPERHRGLSVREAARLQSFPDRFSFFGSIGKKQQQVGNAVPPAMAQAVITSVINTSRKF